MDGGLGFGKRIVGVASMQFWGTVDKIRWTGFSLRCPRYWLIRDFQAGIVGDGVWLGVWDRGWAVIYVFLGRQKLDPPNVWSAADSQSRYHTLASAIYL